MPEETVTKTWDLLKIFDGVAEYTVQESWKLKPLILTIRFPKVWKQDNFKRSKINGKKRSVDFIVTDKTGNSLIHATLGKADALFNTEWHQVSP